MLKRALWLGVGLWLMIGPVLAQPTVRNLLYYELDKTVYPVAEQAPRFPGGPPALREYLNRTVRYPTEARNAAITGRVFVGFVVEADGRLTNVAVLKSLGFGCDEEARRVVRTMPRWKPGKQGGRAVRVRYNLPVVFGPE